MPGLSDRLENVLNESRMLLLGGQVLVGFSYRICFEQRFWEIAYAARLCEILALLVMSAGLGWLIWPAAFHLLAGLVFLAPGIVGDLFVVFRRVTGSLGLASALSAGPLLAFYVLWFGVSLLRRPR